MRRWVGLWLGACGGVPADSGLGPSPPPVLAAPSLTRATASDVTVAGLSPGTAVWVASGDTAGAGACPAALGGTCLGVVGDVYVLGAGVTDASGQAVVRVEAPPELPATAWVQAVGGWGATPAQPVPVGDPGAWRPSPGVTWQWQLQGTLDTGVDVEMYDVDLFDTPAATVDQLQADGRVVICYLSAGSWEQWRPDAMAFPVAARGRPLDGWPGERWLDIRAEAVRDALLARLDLAVAKGCDGVEPDNVDGYANRTGFPLLAADQLDFNRFLAAEAHARGLSVGLKNDVGQLGLLVGWFDWALNEECFAYRECARYRPFVDAGRAVFHVEYPAPGEDPAALAASVCAIGLPFETLIKPLLLGSERYACGP